MQVSGGLELILAFSKQAMTAILLSIYLSSSGQHGLGLHTLKSESLLNKETKQRDLPRPKQYRSNFRWRILKGTKNYMVIFNRYRVEGKLRDRHPE